jgi:hypothetical protein
MANIAIGDAIGSGFGLIRHKPLAVLLWAVVLIIAIGAQLAIFGPLYAIMVSQGLARGAGGAPDFTALTPQLMQINSLGSLASLAALFIESVIYCAVFRAILRPDESRWGYMRLGASEFMFFVLIFGGAFAFLIGLLVALIPIGLIIGVAAALHAVAVAVLFGLIAGIGLIFASIYVALRFSMVGPMIVSDGKFHLFESWHITRGKVGSLFLIALCIVAIVLVAEIVFVIVMGLVAAGAWAAVGATGAGMIAFLHQPPQAMLTGMAPFMAVFAVISGGLGACAFAVTCAPWARAYKDLAGPDLAATFA